MIKMKLSCLFILFGCVYFALGDISFIPKGQRAELFEIMDNEVPTFKITLPPNEFSKLKKVASDNYSLEDINDKIKEIIDTINQQNFNGLFQENDFSEILPELSINEDGYLNLNETDFMINYEEFHNIDQKNYSKNEIVFKILNNNKNLNLIRVFHVLYGLNLSSINEDLLKIINDFERYIMVDKDDNISIIKEVYIREIKSEIMSINKLNFKETFPEINFSELLPELPIQEDGHPNIDFRNYILTIEEYESLKNTSDSVEELIFRVYNKNKNLNINKVLYFLSTSNVQLIDNDFLNDTINNFKYYVMMDEDGNLNYVKENYIQDIKGMVDSLNELNFKEIFPGYNFTELLPELPIKEDGHLNIDFRNYILTTEEYEDLKIIYENDSELVFNIYNKSKYLNINKILYLISTSNIEFGDNYILENMIDKFKHRVMLDDGNFIYIKDPYFQIINNIVNSLNELNFKETFPGYNFTELLPELPIQEDGHPNINIKIFMISNEELEKFQIINDDKDLVVFDILNNNKTLNLIKVFYVLSKLNSSSINKHKDFRNYLDLYRTITMIDKNNNFCSIKESHNIYIKELIDSINEQNFTEVFPGYNFTDILPELPIQEDGHPNIDFRNYLISDEEYDNLQLKYENNKNIIFHIFNNNEYLNLIKVIYTLSKLDNIYNNDSNNHNDDYNYYNNYDYDNYDNYNYNKFIGLLKLYGENNVTMNENNEFIFNNNIENNYDYNYYYTNNTSTIFNQDDHEFKTKNSTLTVQINNKELSFNKITFSLGGQNSRSYAKVGFNLKIRGGKELFGRRQFKLRSDASEPSYMRTKLMCDIHNKLGLPSISANYILLYINDEFMGLYILTDAYKESWIEYVYGEKDTTNLYKCEFCDLTYEIRDGFVNENKEATDKQELYEFLKAMTKAKSSVDVESIFDLDQFYKEIAIEYLSSSWDHILHNYYVYKSPQNNKWIYLIHDFDLDMCSNFYTLNECINYNFKKYLENRVTKRLIYSNIEHFNEILKEIVTNVFNPATLFPRIDEIKSFIKPYVQLDKTPNDVGEYPGRINNMDTTFYTMKQWEASTEFDKSMIGLKQFILLRYRYICKKHNIECDPKYLDENMNMNLTITETSSLYPTETEISSLYPTETEISSLYPTETEISSLYPTETETSSFLIPTSTFDFINIETTTSIEDTILPTTTSIFDFNIDETTTSSAFDPKNIESTTSVEDIILPTTTSIFDSNIDENITSSVFDPTNIESTTSVEDIILPTTTSIEDTILPTSTSLLYEPTETISPISETITTFKCLSEFIGYPCCSSELTTVYTHDEYGDWSYDFTKNEWCGLTRFEDSSNQEDSDECWSEILGYSCCKGCKIFETDSDGSWGYELNQWCGIISSHCQKE